MINHFQNIRLEVKYLLDERKLTFCGKRQQFFLHLERYWHKNIRLDSKHSTEPIESEILRQFSQKPYISLIAPIKAESESK